ncbi:MAG: hypothetical protein EOP56_19430 [Sphingobacteriales bacterium]|nr:MAG: hypothetical protein EOP56_19430 [Sphingobacteriales bacterium]
MKQVLYFIGCLYFFSCKSPTENPAGPAAPVVQKATREPIFPNRSRILNLHEFPSVQLDSLRGGFDSLEVRVWTISGLFMGTDLYVLKRDNQGWTGQHIRMRLEDKFASGDSTREYLHGPWPFEIEKVRQLRPTEWWAAFVSELDLEKLCNLPNMDELKASSRGYTDGTSYYLEYASKGYYHYCSYLDAHRYTDLYPEAKYVARLVDLLRDASPM